MGTVICALGSPGDDRTFLEQARGEGRLCVHNMQELADSLRVI